MIAIESVLVEPLAAWRGHGHAAWHLCLLAAGSFEERIDGAAVTCDAGSVRLSAPGTDHEIAFGHRGAECVVVEVAGPLWSRVLARGLSRHERHRFGVVGESQRWMHDGRLLARAAGVGRLVACARDRAVGDGSARAPAWLEEVRQEIAHDPGWRCGASRRDRSSLSRTFRRHFGMAPAEFRTVARVDRAQTLIAGQGMPLAAAADEAGFFDQSHMSRAFREVTGRRPRDFAGHIRTSQP